MEKKFDADFYRKVLDRINANIYITDVETDEIVYVNEYMKRHFGWATRRASSAGR